jgi:hypothetical protein
LHKFDTDKQSAYFKFKEQNKMRLACSGFPFVNQCQSNGGFNVVIVVSVMPPEFILKRQLKVYLSGSSNKIHPKDDVLGTLRQQMCEAKDRQVQATPNLSRDLVFA